MTAPTETIAEPSASPSVPAPPAAAEVAAVRQIIREAIVPTFEQMMSKPAAVDDIEFELPQESGDPLTCKAHLVALDGPSYDALQGKYPPTAEQRARGQAFNIDKFGPALLSKVVRTPEFNEDQWGKLWSNPRWSGGEISSLFWSANGLCMKGLNVPLRSSG